MSQLSLFPDLKGASIAQRLARNLKLKAEVKLLFFDRDLAQALSPLKRQGLSKIGSHVRTSARSLIRKPRMKSVSELTPEERMQYEQEKQARKAGLNPTRIYVRRSGRIEEIDYRDATKAERRKARIATYYWRKRRARRPLMASTPGSPPRNQTGRLRDNIFFSLDVQRESVVIGPALISAVGEDVPEILEYGGLTTITAGPNEGHRRRIEPRPFMHPAFDANLETIDDVFRSLT